MTDKPVALRVQIKLKFRNVGFWGEGKTGVPGEKPLRARMRTNNKLNPHMMPSPGIKPGPFWLEASALNTAPSLLPIPNSNVQYYMTYIPFPFSLLFMIVLDTLVFKNLKVIGSIMSYCITDQATLISSAPGACLVPENIHINLPPRPLSHRTDWEFQGVGSLKGQNF